ncbi:hypothetical protein ACFQJD_01730 [Haloplanus sp. GCM10025708]|uniref:hypothetical protein n=1 Tax=Haloplanus sp. GCM10025708 TaxID=3252679 RepID=UPI003622BA87
MLEDREWKVIGGATVQMTLNVVLMCAFVVTPIAIANRYLFVHPIVGILVYGAAITGG